MPFSFCCPHCGQSTRVAEQFIGQTGPCVACGRPVTVPAPAPGPGRSLAVAAPPQLPATRNVGAIAALVVGGLLLSGMCVLGLFSAVGVPSVQSAKQVQHAAGCQANMQRVLLAMSEYHNANRVFPAAHTVDGQGQRLHSWRVALLPYLGRQDLYDQIRLDEPWDSAWNVQFRSQMPDVYGCPASRAAGDTDTNYVVVDGRGYVFDGVSQTSMSQITDGTRNTIMLVEMRDSAINWMDPRDLLADEIDFDVNADFSGGISSHHRGGAHVGLADGSVKHVRESMDPDELEALFTIAGGEFVDVW